MSDQVAIYVHVPFCQSKCHYCDFTSFAGLEALIPRYVRAVADEAERMVNDSASFPRLAPTVPVNPRAGTVFFGGGTPSLLGLDDFAYILDRLPNRLPDAEVSIEANPATVSFDLLQGMRDLGINRISFGVQSFDDRALARLGRRHNAAEAVASYDLARKAGFDNVSLDLIFGLPDQDQRAWRETIEKAVALAPEHLSLYGLTIEDGTLFGRLHADGLLAVPDEDAQADMFLVSEEVLGGAGYENYEVSNWARRRGGHLAAARHNLVYWRNQPYLGVGAGAHSYLNRRRFANTVDLEGYLRAIETGASATATSEEIGRELEMAETMMLGLRLSEGVSFGGFRERFGRELGERYGPVIAELQEAGLVAVDDVRITLTPRGRLLGNEAFHRFLSADT